MDDDLKQLRINLKIPAFLVGRIQLIKAEVKESQAIPLVVWIHVKQAISLYKHCELFEMKSCEFFMET